MTYQIDIQLNATALKEVSGPQWQEARHLMKERSITQRPFLTLTVAPGPHPEVAGLYGETIEKFSELRHQEKGLLATPQPCFAVVVNGRP